MRRFFLGPDGRVYTWSHTSATGECVVRQLFFIRNSVYGDLRNALQLSDPNGQRIAFYRPVRPTRYHLGDVYGELHFCSGQTTGVLVSRALAVINRPMLTQNDSTRTFSWSRCIRRLWNSSLQRRWRTVSCCSGACNGQNGWIQTRISGIRQPSTTKRHTRLAIAFYTVPR